MKKVIFMSQAILKSLQRKKCPTKMTHLKIAEKQKMATSWRVYKAVVGKGLKPSL